MLTDCYSLNRSTFSWKQEKVGLFYVAERCAEGV